MTTSPAPADRPADLLRAAAEKLRAARFSGAITATPIVAALIGARLPLAAWLEAEAAPPITAQHSDRCTDPQCTTLAALAVARQLLGTSTGDGARCICGQTACESENCDCDSRTCPVNHAAEETDEEREDREATARDHAAGDHQHCGITCEVELPTDHLRNFVIAKGYPGTAGALDELLRRAAAAASPAPADRAATRDRTRRAIGEASGFTWLPDELMEPDGYGEHADAVLAVLDAPADRAAVLREADWIVEHCPDHGCVEPSTAVCHCEIADRLRRLAGEAAAGAHRTEQAAEAQRTRPTPFECEPGNRCNACAVCWS